MAEGTTIDLDPSLESPVSARGDERTVDTFNFTTYDPTSDIGALFTMNSLPGSPATWRQCVILFHPSGDVLVDRSYGHDSERPGSANLVLTCVEPFRRWRVQFTGYLQQVSAHLLQLGRMADSPEIPVSLDLEYSSVMPAWGHATDGDVAGTHYEQNGFVTGEIRCGLETITYDGFGFRDRIAGPKETARMSGHNWLHGTMRDGAAFALTQAWLKGDPDTPYGGGCVVKDGVVHPARTCHATRWDGAAGLPGAVEVRFDTDLGRTDVLMEPIRSAPWMYVSSPGMGLQSALFGHDRGWHDALLLWESPARVHWDGSTGFGHVEQSLVLG
jgi:hypothetical protein